MNPLDVSFLHLEDGVNHMTIASCAILEGPPPDYENLVESFAAKLPLVPRYRQRVHFVPLQLGRPVWVDDPNFNLAYHVRHTALPKPGTERELRDLMARLMGQELDRKRPLWEVWMVEGLGDGHWALISKVHHCMVDGVSGTDLLAVVLDHDREPELPVPTPWKPERQPSSIELAVRAAVDLATSPYEQLRAVRRATRAPRQALERARLLAGGAVAYARKLAPTQAMSITGSIGPHRRWTWATADLEDVKLVRKAFGGTVNDVVLTVIAGGYRDLLLAHGEPADELVVRTLVPVSVRPPEKRGTYDNLVSAMFADLPVGIADPVERLAAVKAQMAELKQSHMADAGEAMMSALRFAPPTLFALLERTSVRIMSRAPQNSVNTVTTNVPGPAYPLYLCGRQMIEYLPFVPLSYGVRTGVAIVSYNGRLAFGITGDYDTVPDVDLIAHGIEEGMARLVKLAS